MKKRLKDNIFAKISLSVISLLITLIAVELSLKTIGHFYTLSFQQVYIPQEEEEGYVRDDVYERFEFEKSPKEVILTIGDSFTNAGNVDRKDSYPHHLFKLTNDHAISSTVLNMGMCEDSTFNSKKRLEHYLSNVKDKSELPTKVIILTGASDNFKRFSINNDASKLSWHSTAIHPWYEDLSIYKVVRHIHYSYLQKKITKTTLDKAEREKELEAYDKLYKKLKDLKRDKDDDEIVSQVEEVKQRFSRNLYDHFNDEQSIKNANYNETIQLVVFYMSSLYAADLNHAQAVRLILNLASFDPKSFWSGEDDYTAYVLMQSIQFQSEVNSTEILSLLDSMREKVPSIAESDYFKEFYTFITNREEVDSKVDQMRIKTWEEIIKLSKQYNFELIIMNYPSDYVSANNKAKKVADMYQLQLIDLNSYFNNLINKKERHVYLEDDDHLTPLGYKLMAEKIYSEIK